MLLADFSVKEAVTEISGNGCKTVFDEEQIDIMSLTSNLIVPTEIMGNGI